MKNRLNKKTLCIIENEPNMSPAVIEQEIYIQPQSS